MDIDYRKTEFFSFVNKLKDCPSMDVPEIVLAGRSNAGKSSFVNALGDNKNLAKVSSKPGKTRALIYFTVDNKILIADLPGYGYSSADKSSQKDYSSLIDDYLTSSKREFSLIIHFLDIRHEPSQDDVIMSEWVRSKNIPYLIIISKADKLPGSKIGLHVSKIKKHLSLGDDIPVLTLANKKGIEKIRKKITEIIFE